MNRLVMAALAATALLAGCDSGFGFDVTVAGNCAASADQVAITVELSPSGGKTQTVPAADFFHGGVGRVVVVPPQGTTHIKVTLDALARGTKMATAVAETDVGEHKIESMMVGFSGCLPIPDGGADAPMDQGMLDQSVPIDMAYVDMVPPPDLTPPPDLMKPVDFVMPPDLADCRQHMPDCMNGLFCEPNSGACVQCLQDANCPLGQLCDQQLHACTPGCTQGHGCPNAQQCINGKCGCNVNADCGGNGFVCCNKICFDGKGDHDHCGGCNACAQAETCCSSVCKNTNIDPNNCAACGTVCKAANANTDCANGMCFIASCMAPFEDCYNGYPDGCETNLNTNVNNCGACGNVCAVANGTGKCVQGGCQIATCNPGWRDCNNFYDDGCETNIGGDPFNCSACGMVCNLDHVQQHQCMNGNCTVFVCDFLWGNCDNANGNGCERDLSSDVNNCGACNAKCGGVQNATPSCQGGTCVPNCVGGFEDCDGVYGNGCEVNINTDPNNCGGCFLLCDGGQICVAGMCEDAPDMSDGSVGDGPVDMSMADLAMGFDMSMPDMTAPPCGSSMTCNTGKDPVNNNPWVICMGSKMSPPRISGTQAGAKYYIDRICRCLGWDPPMAMPPAASDSNMPCGNICGMPLAPNFNGVNCGMDQNGRFCTPKMNTDFLDWVCQLPLMGGPPP